MMSEDRFYQSLSPINSAGDDDFLKNSKLKPQRKRQAPNELPKAKGKGKRKKKGRSEGESSEAEPKGKEESVKELIIVKKKSVPQVLKILRDRVNRRIKIGQRADMESCIHLMCSVIEHRVDDLFSPIVQSLNEIKSQWPTRSDLDGIKKNIKEMEDEERDKEKLHKRDDVERKMEVITDDMIWRLEEIELNIKTSDEEFRKDSTKAINLDEIFLTEGVSVETLREKLTTAFPWIFLEEVFTNELPSAINREEVFTTEIVAEPQRLEIAGIDPEGHMCKGIDGATSSMTPANDPYGIPQAVKVLDSLSEEVPKASSFYLFSLRLLANDEKKRLVFLSISPEQRVWWLEMEMERSKFSNGP